MTSDIDRFWSKVDKNGPIQPHMDTPCWIWTASKSPKGYGHCKINGKDMRAHRASYQIIYGAIPEGLFACHKCDNPACERPDHLWLGTNQENIQDCHRKGRHGYGVSYGDTNGMHTHPESILRGEQNPSAKLTAAQVQQMRYLYKTTNVSIKALATKFNIASGTTSRILKKTKWAHVPDI